MLIAHLICHSHWDREWYLTKMQFRTKLVRLIDGLLALAEDSPDYVSFMLDGQTIALEDYLEIKPYNRDRLIAAVQSEKIIIGPWYILPDEMLISGESYIRNYLTGDAIAKQFGKKMEIGYLPDSFGHPAQVPQILRGLGMDATVFWRGARSAMDKTEFYWRAPDGESEVLCVNMPNGYATGGRLLEGGAKTVERLERMMDILSGRSSVDALLLMNGSDHLLAEKNIPEIVADFNAAAKDKQIKFSTMRDFIADVRAQLPADTKTFSGDIASGDQNILLGGTISTRMYLKQRNHTVQKKLERYLEPIISHEKLAGGAFDFAGYQKYLWKLVLENHPHDSICGCSIDALHEEMMTRFMCLEQLEDQLLADTGDRLGTGTGVPDCDAELLLFEPGQDQLPSYTEVDVQFDRIQKLVLDYSISTTRRLDGELPPLPQAVRAVDETGREIPCTLLSAEPCEYVLHLSDDDLPQVFHANKLRVALLLPGFAYGAHRLRLFRADETQEAIAQAAQQPSEAIENAFYRVAFDRESAAFAVTDKKTGKVHEGVNRFVDMGDAGDEYSYSWPDTDRVLSLEPQDIRSVTAASVSGLADSIVVEAVLRLPEKLAADRKSRAETLVACPVRITVTLHRDIDAIDFETEIENCAEDHRLQVEFPVGELCAVSSGSAAFAVTQHPVERPVPPVWEEYPFTTMLTHGFVDAGDGAYGISLASHGMTEYEVKNSGDTSFLRLTLLRCVGWLSRPDLNSRKINGGWELATPGGQCKGSYAFRYSIAYHEDTWQAAGTYPRMDRALHPVWLHQSLTPLRDSGNPLGFLSNLPQLVRLSAVKTAEDESGIILRFFSLQPDTAAICLPLPACVREARLVSLAEQELETLTVDADRQLHMSVGFGKIVSVKLVMG